MQGGMNTWPLLYEMQSTSSARLILMFGGIPKQNRVTGDVSLFVWYQLVIHHDLNSVVDFLALHYTLKAGSVMKLEVYLRVQVIQKSEMGNVV